MRGFLVGLLLKSFLGIGLIGIVYTISAYNFDRDQLRVEFGGHIAQTKMMSNQEAIEHLQNSIQELEVMGLENGKAFLWVSLELAYRKNTGSLPEVMRLTRETALDLAYADLELDWRPWFWLAVVIFISSGWIFFCLEGEKKKALATPRLVHA